MAINIGDRESLLNRPRIISILVRLFCRLVVLQFSMLFFNSLLTMSATPMTVTDSSIHAGVWHHVVCFLVISPGNVQTRAASSAILLQYLVNEQLFLGASCIPSATFLLHWQQILLVHVPIYAVGYKLECCW